MTEERLLNGIEHYLLSLQTFDIIPLYSFYADTFRDVEGPIKGATLEIILQALVKLVEMGFSKAYLVDGERQPVEKLTLADLKQHFAGMTEEEKSKYPMYVPEYYFEITEKGKEEEAKAVYDAYYPE